MTLNQKSGWTLERVAELRQLASEKFSAGQMGAALGVTRNAVIGKARRMGIPLLGQLPSGMDWRRTHEPNTPRATPRPRKHRRKPANHVPTPRVTLELAATEATDLQAEPNRNGILFFDSQPHHCRWPLNDQTEIFQFLFCGADKLEPFPYCGFYTRLAYQLPVDRQRRAA